MITSWNGWLRCPVCRATDNQPCRTKAAHPARRAHIGRAYSTATAVEAELLGTWPANQITDEMREAMTALMT
jgi:hypothetical protein